jgi:hypothetical protein
MPAIQMQDLSYCKATPVTMATKRDELDSATMILRVESCILERSFLPAVSVLRAMCHVDERGGGDLGTTWR